MKIAVLGAGMIGRTIAMDLANQYAVTSFDISTSNLDQLRKRNASIQTITADLSQVEKYTEWLSPFEIVITAVPGFIGYKTLKAVINAGKNVVDISFFSEDTMQLDALAKEKNVTVITDCGVAPGISNFILGRYNAIMKITSFECYVGGLPKNPIPPYYYKAPFSPADVIQEYVRPARFIENGKVITKPALTDRELIHFDELGELEAFNTDGLRSLLQTMNHIPDMKEKTLRYPGHIDKILSLQSAGLFENAALESTSKMLFNEWKLGEEEEEFTIMKVVIRGDKKIVVYTLIDRYDTVTKTSSMARTTGYTCTAAVNLIARKMFIEKGVFPPEIVGKDKSCFDFIVSYLQGRNVKLKMTNE